MIMRTRYHPHSRHLDWSKGSKLTGEYIVDVSGWISHYAAWSKNKIALRYLDTEITYGELESHVARLAATLAEDLNISMGDRIAFLGLNSPEHIKLFFACNRIGAIWVPLNARMTVEQLKVFIADSEPKLLIAEPEFGQHAESCLSESPETKLLLLQSENTDGSESTGTEFLKPGTAKRKWNGDIPDQTPVMLAYTSGTTGKPKGAVHTNASFAAAAANMSLAFGLNSHSQTLTYAPLFHIGGLPISTLPSLYAGASVTIHRELDSGLILSDITKYGVATVWATPPVSRALFNDPGWETADLSNVKAAVTGATRVPIEHIDRWQERGIPLVQMYAMTEAISPILIVPTDHVESKKGSLGILGRGYEVRLVDDQMNDVRPGETGEMVLRGPPIIKEYWNNPKANNDAFVDGWFRTGDAAHQDEDGFFYMDDRIKEIIIVGSSNVYPADLERVLDSSDAIAECAVIARDDDEFGEVPIVFIILKTGHSIDESEVMALFKQSLATYQHPREIHFIDEFPRTALGKINKSELRTMQNNVK
jgi:fatty-acyl-CoA synthase